MAPPKKTKQTEAAEQPAQNKVRIVLKAFDGPIIDAFVQRILETAERTGAEIVGPVPLPTNKRRFTLIRSPHIDKDSREYFELRVHKRLIDILNPSSSTIEALTHLNAPSGVHINIKV